MEMKALGASGELREDMRRLATLARPLSSDEWIDFLTAYNEFINHRPRPFRPFRETKMLL